MREIEEKGVVSDLDKQHVQLLHLRYLHSLYSTVIVPRHNIYEEYSQSSHNLITSLINNKTPHPSSLSQSSHHHSALFSILFMRAGLKHFGEKLDAVSK